VPAKQLLEQMNQEGVFSDKFIASSMISAYATKAALREGKWMHASLMGTAFETDTVVSTALLNMYCKCGSLVHARSVFDEMTARDAVSWNAMMDGYAQYGDVTNVRAFFDFMRREGVAPDAATFVSSLSACARLVALTEGRRFYNGSILRGFEAETAVATAIFDMCAKCGSLQEASKMFDNMPERNEVSWSAMIAAYSRHGRGKQAILLFERMLAAGCRPNEVTFVSVLYACSHAGLLEEGRRWWHAMRCDHGIAPIPDHFDCMIDLYCRTGRLEEAEDLIADMPVDPTAVSWMTLLSACRSKTDLCRAARAAKRILDLDASDPSPHPILHNLFAASIPPEKSAMALATN
jgi:pentatricopeptide repeat protein